MIPSMDSALVNHVFSRRHKRALAEKYITLIAELIDSTGSFSKENDENFEI